MSSVRNNREALIAMFLLAASTTSGAQQAAIFACIENHAEPSAEVVVPGFQGERLYLHTKHPDSCRTGSADCASSAYVVTGDRLMVTASCGSWTFASFKGVKKLSSGWVATRRLSEGHDDVDLPTADPRATPKNPVCSEARDLLNRGLLAEESGQGALPTAVVDEQSVERLPNDVDREFHTWDARIGNVQIQDKPFKVVSYHAGGTCYAGYVELWNADFTEHLPAETDPNSEAGLDGYSEEALVQLQGKPFLAHFNRGGRKVRLFGFDEHLTPYAACDISMARPARESIRSATDTELCEAVRDGKVSGAPIDDIEAFPLSAESLSNAPDGAAYSFTGGGWHHWLVARGRLDADNDGMPDDVGIVAYSDDSGAGCGHEYRASWPVKLDSDGMPAAGVPFNTEARKIAGGDDESRLFIFRGTTYYERRSRPGVDGIPAHEVWKLTTSAPVQACVFNAVTYVASE